jgi:hypothetical protein
MDDEIQTPSVVSVETVLAQPDSDIKSTETVLPPSTAQAAKTQAALTEIAAPEAHQQHVPSQKSTPISAGALKRRLWHTALILIIIGLVVTSMIGWAKSNNFLVTDPPSNTQSYNVSNLGISTSADSYYTTSTFSKGQDVYIYFDLNYVQAGTSFSTKWYYQVGLLGKEVYLLTTTLAYTSESGDKNINFHLNKPEIKGYYRVDIYMNDSLVGTRYFSVQ